MLRNLTRSATLSRNPRIAWDPWTRARGMIGRSFRSFDALIFPRCRSIHTCFMSRPLDVIFLDQDHRVVDYHESFRPWKMTFGPRGTRTVIELPPGTLCGIGLARGDQLSWQDPHTVA